MSKIDWRKAPEWADGHGLVAHHGITEVWINMDQYAVVGAEDRAYPYGGGTGDHRHNFTRGQVQYITPRPTRWDGEGLPPVGTACEFAGGEDCPHDPWDKDLRVGDQVTIIAHFDGGNGDQLAAFTFPTKNPNRGAFNVEQGRWGCFRPIRTPEQIAAEKYEADAADLAEVMTGHRDRSKDCYLHMAKVILDAGYRKQVAP